MAAPQCMTGDGEPAVFVGTMLQTGDAFTLCDGCLVMWSAALLQSMTGVDAAPFISAISDEEPIAGTEHGAPTDEPPPPGPADLDMNEAARIEYEEAIAAGEKPPMPSRSTSGRGGRTPKQRRSDAAATGGSSVDD